MKCLSRYNSTFFGRKNQAKFENDCISRNGHRIKITQPNSMILVSFSSAEDVLSTDVKSMTLSLASGKSAVPLFGTPGIELTL